MLREGGFGFAEIREEEIFGTSVFTVTAILHGVHRADSIKRFLKDSAYLEKITELFPSNNFEISIARIHAEPWADLGRNGIHIDTYDLTIVPNALFFGVFSYPL